MLNTVNAQQDQFIRQPFINVLIISTYWNIPGTYTQDNDKQLYSDFT